ncbi:hypothetical protein JCM5353_001566 [Sporobolomyces roseus]
MIVGIGVDLLHLPRLRSLLKRRNPQQLASRILSNEELQEWKEYQVDWNMKQKESYLALRWTAKEAAYKALYPLAKPTWKDLVVKKLDKKPILQFSPSFLSASNPQHSLDSALDQLTTHLSVSHDGAMMVAYVVVEKG